MTYRDKLEPEALTQEYIGDQHSREIFGSIAISLKRIADTLEKHQPIDWNTTGVQG